MNIYEVLNKVIVNKKYELSSRLFDDKYRDELIEKDVIVFDLLKNISSIGTEIHNSGIKFHPMFTMADGRRTFSVEDITEEDFSMLEAMDLNRVPLVLRALIADILWSQRKVYCAAKLAAEACWDLYNHFLEQKAVIEEFLGEEITWHEASIDAVFGYDTYNADFNNDNWDKYFEWYCEKAIKLREVVKRFVE